MKKIILSLTLLVSFYSITKAQQPMTIAPGLNITSPTAGTSGLKFNSLNSGTTVSTTPTKVLSLDASGNVILGNAPAATTQLWTASGSDITFYTGLVGIGNGNSGVSANLDIYNVAATDAIPQLGLDAGVTGINITRFSGTGGSFGGKLYETVITGSTNTAASVAWKHTNTDFNGTLTTTPMMTLTGAGNMTVNGFTKLGGTGADVPSIKQKYLTGSTNSSASVFTTLIAHGLDVAKIISMDVLVVGFNNVSPPTNTWYAPGYRGSNNISTLANEYWAYFDATNITIERSSTQGQNLVNKNYRIVITYIQ